MSGNSLRRRVEAIKLWSLSYQTDRDDIEAVLEFPFQSFKKEIEMLQNCDAKIFELADTDIFSAHLRDQWSKKLLGIFLEALLDSCDGKTSVNVTGSLYVLLENISFDFSQSKHAFVESIAHLTIEMCRTIALVFTHVAHSNSKLKEECSELVDIFWNAFLSENEAHLSGA